MTQQTAQQSQRITKLEPRMKPEAKDIIQEVRDAVQAAASLGVFDKILTAHETRRCLWAGQSADGMLWGENAFPWAGAIDSRVPLADEIVSDHVRIRMASLRAGNVQIAPQDSVDDAGKASQWDGVLRFYRQAVKRNLTNQFKLFFTCVEEIGYGIMHVDWRDRKRLKPFEITPEAVMSVLAQQMITRMAEELQMDPDTMQPDLLQQAADDAARVYETMLADKMAEDSFVAALQVVDLRMPTSEAKRVIRDFRKGLAVSTYYAPISEGGLPCIQARIPWVNLIHGLDLGTSGQTTFFADVEKLSEVDVRIRAAQEEWPKGALESVLEHPNKGLTDLMGAAAGLSNWVLNGVGIGLTIEQNPQDRAPMFEIITVYRTAVNEAGIPAIYESVINAHVQDVLLKHECCEVDEMPFVVEQREPAGLAVQSRGIPEIILTDQLALKKLKDATTAAAELAAFPPTERDKDDTLPIQPGAQLKRSRYSTGSGGTQQKFLDVPGVDMGALKSMEMTRADIDRLFVRGKEADPDSRRLFLEDLGSSAVLSYEAVISLMWLHIQAYVKDLTASRIAGRPVSVQATAEDLEGRADVHVEFSPMALNQKMALELAEWGTKLAGLDRSGRIDFGAFVEVISRMFDSTLADRIIMPAEAAAEEIERDEQQVISAIVSGQYVRGHVNSPQARWKKLNEWLSNPETMPMLQARPTVYAALTEHIKGLSQEQIQSTENVAWGQTGQNPIPPWQEQQKPEAMLKHAVEGGPTAMAA